MENFEILNSVSDEIKEKFVNGIYDRDLVTFEEAGFSKEFENISEGDLIEWTQQAKERDIDPSIVVASCTDLNYAYKNKNYPFRSVYIPKNIFEVSRIAVDHDSKPYVHFNFMAGNYHRSRYKLLEKFWQYKFLENDNLLFWSSYRFHYEDSNLYNEKFLEFMKSNTPRTFLESAFYNVSPDAIDLSTPQQQFIKDINNKDTWIYNNSLISIVIDSFGSLFVNQTFNHYNTTAKSFKAIKHKRPFILTIGTQGNDLKYFKRLGFKTFDSVWDESYDKESGIKRLDAIADLCYNLSNRSVAELYEETKEICEYNYSILQNTDWIDWYFKQLDSI